MKVLLLALLYTAFIFFVSCFIGRCHDREEDYWPDVDE